MKLAVAVAIAGIGATAGVAAAQSMSADPEPGQDCSLLDDRERSLSWLRHLRWSVKAGSRGPRGMFAPSIGIDFWTSEVLCRREQLFESELVYHRVALAARLDYEHDVADPERSGVRPAIELSSGNNAWAWLGIAAAAGPRFDDRGVSASGSVSLIYLGIDMEVRVDSGLSWSGHQVGVFVGLTDLHLLLPSLFSDYQQP